MRALVPSVLGMLSIAVGFIMLVCISTTGCGDDAESSDAGPVDAGEIDCEDACEDFLDINHIVEHVTELG